ncbi:prion-inhibition and propagation-domain-containing protein [Immersiella caudata]|uniref:Prion-inhibition and propagation-domain-containing protein n=1 Tax=Immersiella caudata TaxID=314043 RepID=A0AA39WLK4_9PEZI|nr:prion-inhibition and propagation-domain-containing protein [Immersiella caudata]
MAEILGTVSAALSLVGFFNNCVDCFGYIQLGRHFGQDYRLCQLRLDIARTRLGRWGEALAWAILEEVMLLLETAAKTSKRYELRAAEKDLARFNGEKDLGGVHRKLHQRLRALSSRRLKSESGSVGLAKRTAWALYDAKQFEKLITQVLELVDELERAFPVAEGGLQTLAAAEVVEVCGEGGVDDEEETLKALKEAAIETDKMLADAVEKRLEKIAGAASNLNYAKEISVGDLAQVQVGNEYTEAFLAASSFFGTTNMVDVVVAKGSARVHVGSRFGVRY